MINILLSALLLANIGMFFWKRSLEKKENADKAKVSVNWITAVVAVLDALCIGVVVLLLCSFEAHWYTRVTYILAGLMAEASLIALMTRWFNKRRFILWCVAAVLTLGAILGCFLYDRHLKNITLPDYFNYTTYTPFSEESLVKTLEEEPSLVLPGRTALPRMDGATALYPVYAAFAQAVYPDLNGLEPWQIREYVSCSTTTHAYENIVDGTCDIIFVGGPSEEQEAYAAEKGVELVYTPIGREAFVFFVHPSNPLDSLTLEQIQSIYSGETVRWDQLGVKGLGSIRAYQRDEGSGSQTALERFVMRDKPLMESDKENVVGGMGGIVEQVSPYRNHRNAIGFSFRFYCTALMKNFDVKLLAVDGIAPTVENIENGSYPLASVFYAVTRSDADANTRALAEWACGPQGQLLVEKTGYSPLPAE